MALLNGASILSLGAGTIYIFVAGFLCSAAVFAKRTGQKDWHWQSWAMLALVFFALAAMRFVNAEDLIRDALRESLRASDAYSDRRTFQRPVVAGLIFIVAAAAAFLFYRAAQTIRGRRNTAVAVAIAGSISMLFLVALRILSLHPVDAVLFGPLKVNWFADLGLTLVVALSALAYNRILRFQ